mmetsp:Transcript_63560/g.138428  ORF Transcript_63560/g.138428 Transcript_63560/m.138428 type:complete len:536 (-) Transcript_63560:74-1681(-)
MCNLRCIVTGFLSVAVFTQVACAEYYEDVSDEVSALQVPDSVTNAQLKAAKPSLIQLRRESVPVYRRGKVASFKTSYSGVLEIGHPAQEFRVVFDTGSGHLVVPAVECKSESCLIHRRYNLSASETALAINTDGSPVSAQDLADQITVGFGTGSITGEFVRDRVCIRGNAADETADANASSEKVDNSTNTTNSGLCFDMQIIVALEMSAQPFKTFHFDGILGLGLRGLAISEGFSAFGLLSRQLGSQHFGAFLTEGEDGEVSEMAFGGYNPERLLEPLSWAPVALPELGYWQVEIVAVRVDGRELDICSDGTCRGVVDTGTSHLGVPASYNAEMAELLTTPAGDILDCRLAKAPTVEIQLKGFNITLDPHNYMRRLPLREGISVGSATGVSASSQASSPPAPSPEAKAASETVEEAVNRFCRPRLMPVRLAPPLGPKLFILGEPVLHRYYTVYDWRVPQVGFGLANTVRNTKGPSHGEDFRGHLPKEVDMLLMQNSITKVHHAARVEPSKETLESFEDSELGDEVVMLQVSWLMS